MIKAEHLTKHFGQKVAVDNISFEVESNKISGFLGPNGAGKSTTMRLMLGLARGQGVTLYDGKPLHHYPQPSKLVGILLEAKAYHPTRSARNHLRVLATAGNIPFSRVEEVLDIVGLKAEAKSAPGKFSLGMSQRLGIAAAILGQPKYLILDEPANGLDPEGMVWLRQFLKSYAEQSNGVFVSSHLLSEMAQMADNVIVIGKGKLLASTTTKQLIAGNVRTSLFVRVGKPAVFERLLKERKIANEKVDNGIQITGVSTDEIGKLAFGAGIPILELTTRTASLEEAFLELTVGAEEFAARPGGGSK
jgi:ABC-2 type transport system ATP-binding protein